MALTTLIKPRPKVLAEDLADRLKELVVDFVVEVVLVDREILDVDDLFVVVDDVVSLSDDNSFS